jgi:hypothetical protein
MYTNYAEYGGPEQREVMGSGALAIMNRYSYGYSYMPVVVSVDAPYTE